MITETTISQMRLFEKALKASLIAVFAFKELTAFWTFASISFCDKNVKAKVFKASILASSLSLLALSFEVFLV